MAIQQKKSPNSLRQKKFKRYKRWYPRKAYIKLPLKRLRHFQSRVKNKSFFLLKALKTASEICKNKTTKSKFWKTKSWAFKFRSRRKNINFRTKTAIFAVKPTLKFKLKFKRPRNKLTNKRLRTKLKKKKFRKGSSKKTNKRSSWRKPFKRLFWQTWKLKSQIKATVRRFLKIKMRLQERQSFNKRRGVKTIKKARVRLFINYYKLKILKGKLKFLGRLFEFKKLNWRTKKKYWKRYTVKKGFNFKRQFKTLFLKGVRVKRQNLKRKLGILRRKAAFYKKYNLIRYYLPLFQTNYIKKKYGARFIPSQILYIKKRIVKDDHFFFNIINYYANNFFFRGCKKKALKNFFQLFELTKFNYKTSLKWIFFAAVNNVRPLLYFRPMYIGGKKYKIPVLLNEMRGIHTALRWLLSNSRLIKVTAERKQILHTFNELILSSKNEGPAVKKRKDHHLVAYENKTYIRFLRFLK